MSSEKLKCLNECNSFELFSFRSKPFWEPCSSSAGIDVENCLATFFPILTGKMNTKKFSSNNMVKNCFKYSFSCLLQISHLSV